MSSTAKTCEYFIDPEDPKTWGGKDGEECKVVDEVLNEDGVWTCPRDAKEGASLCVFHLPVGEKDDDEVVEAFFDVIDAANANEAAATRERRLQFLGARFGTFNVDPDSPELVTEKAGLVLTHAEIVSGLNWSDWKLEIPYLRMQNVECGNEADFSNVEFGCEADFSSAEFRKGANFGTADFGGETDFSSAEFGGNTNFSGAAFRRDANFFDADFDGNAEFGVEIIATSGAEFRGDVDFHSAEFADRANFQGVEFGGDVKFVDAAFRGQANFSEVLFGGDTAFGAVTVRTRDATSASFSDGAYFTHATFEGDAEFRGVKFDNDARFKLAKFRDKADFRSGEFGGDVEFSLVEFKDNANFARLSIENSDFRKADLTDAVFTGTDLRDANLESALLSRATLFGADLRGAKLSGTVLGDVRIDEDTKFLGHAKDDSETSPHTLSAIRSSQCCIYDPSYRNENETNETDKAKSVYRALEELGGKAARPRLQARCFVRRQDLQKRDYWEDATDPDSSLEERVIAGARWSRARTAELTLLYGESPWRIIAYSLGTILAFGLAYPLGGWIETTSATGLRAPVTYARIVRDPILLWKSIYHSAMLFATGNRYGGVKAINLTGEVLTTVEALLGPTLLALLVFVLGRRAAR